MSDSTGREIITLQVGRYANFVGTHFWNFQDELLLLGSREGVVDDYYDHSVLHRAPSSEGGVRSPRLVAFDTRDALGSLNPLGLVGASSAEAGKCAFSSPDAAQSSWTGGVSVFRQPQREKNALHAYLDAEDDEMTRSAEGQEGRQTQLGDEGQEDENQDVMVTDKVTRLMSHPFGLDDTVNTWPDFLKARLHPRALQELPFRDESSDFGLYTAGSGGSSSGGALGEGDRAAYSDALRRQLEECDAPQGTQTLVDLEGGWGGLATSLAIELDEECRNRPRVCYALLRRDGAPAAPGCRVPGVVDASGKGWGAGARGARSAVNLALSLHGLGDACSLTCLLDEEACSQVSPHMELDPSKLYHTSAVLGAALDLATSPLRFSRDSRLDAWANGRGGVAMGGGSGAFGGGERAPPPGANMSFATMSAWFPFPEPDASAEHLGNILGRTTSRLGGDGSKASSLAPSGSLSTPSNTWSVQGRGMVSLAPRFRKQRSASKRRQEAVEEHGARVFSRTFVARGLTTSRANQLSVMGQVLMESGVGAGSAYAASTPLPVPITYPLLFRESVGSRGEALPVPVQSHVSAAERGGRDGRRIRVMCDDVSGVTAMEKSSTVGTFIGQVAEDLDLRRGGVLLELEKNGLQKDDAVEVVEHLTAMAESYGFSPQERNL